MVDVGGDRRLQPADAAGSARTGLQRLAARVGASLRAGSAAAGGAAAIVGIAPPASPPWVLTTVAVLVGWTAFYATRTWTGGFSTALVLADVAVVTVLCLVEWRLVAAEALTDGSNWIMVLASTTVIVSQFHLRPAAGIPAGVVIASAHAAGIAGSGQSGWGAGSVLVLLTQALVTAVLMSVLRRASATADEIAERAAAAETAAAVRLSRRADERERYRLLHDGACATLTMVSVSADLDRDLLREQAARDLVTLDRMRGLPAPPAGFTSLDSALRQIVRDAVPALAVDCVLAPVQVPAPVGEAVAASVAAGLSNVSRHSGVDRARIRVSDQDGMVVVELTDRGSGFDPAMVPPNRRGIRESIVARMLSVGGSASVRSGPGAGTSIVLRWCREPTA